jgi:Uma2 family endonuclease
MTLEQQMTVELRPPSMQLKLAGEETDIDLASIQGLWSVEQYLRLTDQTNRMIEFTDGVIEVLPMPTKYHQAISKLLFLALLTLVQRRGGDVFYAPLRVQIRPGKFREPDLLVVLDKHDPRAQDEFWLGADLAVEIVSPDRPKRDLEEKPRDYAEAGISEYWIVNPLDQTVTVLTLDHAGYVPFGVFPRGSTMTSKLLADVRISVDTIFDAS